jgi:hypothetical protein
MRPQAIRVLLLVLPIIGCGDARTQPPAPTQAAAAASDRLGAAFDPTRAGIIRGRVAWTGDIPAVKPFDILFNPDSAPLLREKQQRDNPNAPIISATRGVGNAVVYLRGVIDAEGTSVEPIDPKRSRSWNHPSVSVEIRGGQLHVLQGTTDSRIGFVRRGAAIDMVSRESWCHSLHAGGAAFFTMPFPDPDQPLSRTLSKNGVVELSSNAGFFWMRAYLFVDEHPYYVQTDAEGNFELGDVPAGDYELVAWLPNWVVKEHDRDPETGFISRVRFAAPLEVVQKVRVTAGETTSVRVEMSAK